MPSGADKTIHTASDSSGCRRFWPNLAAVPLHYKTHSTRVHAGENFIFLFFGVLAGSRTTMENSSERGFPERPDSLWRRPKRTPDEKGTRVRRQKSETGCAQDMGVVQRVRANSISFSPPQRGGMPKPSGMPHFFLAFGNRKAYRYFSCISALPRRNGNVMQSGRVFFYYGWYYGFLSGRKRDGDA